jgi:DNA modification methylase
MGDSVMGRKVGVNDILRIIHGDALTSLRALPDSSVQTCVTSPPYWGLRDYGTGGNSWLRPPAR